jgi:hypothetical protein
VLVLGLLACSSDEGTAPTTTAPTTTSTVPTPTLTGDGTPFCDAMLGVGQIAGAEGATPEEVLASTNALAARLDDAQATTPEDAPPDFDALLDDYRLAIEAIRDADGDVEVAFAALGEEQPEVVARLGSSTSHEEAFAFLVERCGGTP